MCEVLHLTSFGPLESSTPFTSPHWHWPWWAVCAPQKKGPNPMNSGPEFFFLHDKQILLACVQDADGESKTSVTVQVAYAKFLTLHRTSCSFFRLCVWVCVYGMECGFLESVSMFFLKKAFLNPFKNLDHWILAHRNILAFRTWICVPVSACCFAEARKKKKDSKNKRSEVF